MIVCIVMAALGMVAAEVSAQELALPRPGDWVRYRVMPASEWTPAAVDELVLTLGPSARLRDTDLVWWQMEAVKPGGDRFVVQALSERAPMTTAHGDLGAVFIYRFRQADLTAVEYVDARTGLAYLPIFGFRTGLVPTPRGQSRFTHGFRGAGNYIGQALAAQDWGDDGQWLDLEPVRVTLDDDLLIGTARMFRDDGSGTDEDGEYTYVELTPEDYDRMIEAGFNLFTVNNKHQRWVRERGVFFVRGEFGNGGYPDLLYRSNYWGAAMFTDEPAVRMNASECRTVHDAANLLRLRAYAYHRMPGNPALDRRLAQSDGVIQMIHDAGFNTGDWSPLQLHIPVWETIHESAFYQLQGGAAGIVHEGRYQLNATNGVLQNVLGPGAQVDADGMYDLTYCFLRGAARCMGGDWGTAIYGQADYSLAPQAVRQAYDMGARYIWFWTSDHDHHLPFPKQLELAKVARDRQKQNPRLSRLAQVRSGRVAVAIPDGYITTGGPWMWGSHDFALDKLNELGTTYGDINSLAHWELYRLIDARIDFDCVVDVPGIIDNAGYDGIIRIGADGRVNLPAPAMPSSSPRVEVSRAMPTPSYDPPAGAPVVRAAYRGGSIRIDGALDDWQGADWIELTDGQMYEVAGQKWGGAADLSAEAALAYDDEAVYVAVKVRDDVASGVHRGDRIWQNDSVQVAFDPFFNPHTPLNYAPDDSEIGFSIVDGHPVAHSWKRGHAGPSGMLPGAEVAIEREGDTTIYEARVPFDSLWPLTPAFPGRCGVNVAVNDSDDGTRKGAIGWRSGLADTKNPSNFGVLEFVGAADLPGLPAMVFAEASRTVVRQGEKAEFVVTTGTKLPRPIDLRVTVRYDNLRAVPVAVKLIAPAGMSHFAVSLDTSGLESAPYTVDFEAAQGGLRQGLRLYVLPRR